jgi:hypothetical protein
MPVRDDVREIVSQTASAQETLPVSTTNALHRLVVQATNDVKISAFLQDIAVLTGIVASVDSATTIPVKTLHT